MQGILLPTIPKMHPIKLSLGNQDITSVALVTTNLLSVKMLTVRPILIRAPYYILFVLIDYGQSTLFRISACGHPHTQVRPLGIQRSDKVPWKTVVSLRKRGNLAASGSRMVHAGWSWNSGYSAAVT